MAWCESGESASLRSSDAGGDTCCSLVTGVCEVQIQHGAANEYQDVEGMRTRTEDLVDGSVVVSDFVTNKTMLINVCQHSSKLIEHIHCNDVG